MNLQNFLAKFSIRLCRHNDYAYFRTGLVKKIMGRRRYIKAVVPVKFPGEVTYALPEGVEAETGDWVTVPFGAKKYLGTVTATDIAAEIPDNRIKDIITVEQLPKVSEQEISLWRQISEYYMCTIGEVFKCAYPPRKVAREEQRAQKKEASEQRKARLAYEIEAKLAREFSRIEKKIIQSAASREDLFIKSRVLGRFLKEDRPIIQIKEYSREEIRSLSRILAERMSSGKGGKQENTGENRIDAPVLSKRQEAAKNSVLENFAIGKRVLLKGVAGSGKTEIYASIAADIMKSGKSVLMLVPEISLSRQLEDRIKSFFHDKVLVYHSKEPYIKKDEVSSRLRSGENLFILGTRSALFLPWPNLGCIIVDEENDSSYKQTEPAPRYNGRDTAALLSAITGSPLLLGSATPSYESIYNVITGKLAEVCIDERYHKGGVAETIIIDTLAERRKRGMHGSVSRKLAGMMQDTLNAGKQIMIFRSRRSYSPVLQCGECGEMPKCPDCNAYLSHHKSDGYLECHYCGSRFEYTGTCPKCGGQLKGRGAGTEKIEEEIKEMFPHARVARLDSDIARNPAVEKKTLRDFAAGETDILIGTQVIAKGFDFSNVSLVAILNADSLIGIQNFRADENALQLLEQLKGRCARREQNGLFVIQTEQPEHPVYRRFLLHEPEEEGLKERQAFDYPPFTRMVEITIRGKDEKCVSDDAGKLYRALLSSGINGHVGIPVSPQVDKIAGRHLCVIRIRLKRDRNLPASKRRIIGITEDIMKNSRSEYFFNPDPL